MEFSIFVPLVYYAYLATARQARYRKRYAEPRKGFARRQRSPSAPAKRTGIDYQRFDKNRMSKKPLSLGDRKFFPEGKERFSLGSHDLSRVLKHTKIKKGSI